ncbi:Tll0287-like domain-containing protein [Halobacteriovorax sp.]|uniref:Tll0287-like domain-containing protein n=1 Tax=Halobacteriovorax sp. TaxID=2020862 RepID=UPI003AF20DC9
MKKIIFLVLLSFSTLAGQKEALEAIQKTAMALKKELQSAMKVSPVNAIEVCNTKAMPITKKYHSKGIEVGRVSLKNRNPDNTVKDWMKETIDAYESGSNKKGYSVVRISNNQSGIIKPIKTMPLCLNCHGSNIKPEVSARINKLYPADKATGYKTGDTRGYFWATFKTK